MVQGRIDYGRVVLGGIVAGVIVNAFEFLLNGWYFAAAWPQVMSSINRPVIGTNAVAWFTVIAFAFGIAAVWTYAAIRPRFGAGPGTAVVAAVAVWLVGYLLAIAQVAIIGVYPLRMAAVMVAVGLVELILGTIAGAYFYREQD